MILEEENKFNSEINFSLCIPTMDRFDGFLNKNLQKYLEYLDSNIINEIVICDENGEDCKKIAQNEIFKNYIKTNQLRLYTNNEVLGVFLNKIKVCSLAKNDYIALIDSDNFCDDRYFDMCKNYIFNNNLQSNSYFVLSPSFARPSFNFKEFEDNVITKKNIRNYLKGNKFGVLINTGNFVLTKNLIQNLKFNNNKKILENISACDVMYFNLLLFKQFETFKFIVVKNLEYDHEVHEDSIYMKTNEKCTLFREMFIKPEFFKLL